MRILYLCHRVPHPPDKGEKIRAHHYIRHLAGRHEVHVACPVEDPEELAHAGALRRTCTSVDAVHHGRLARRLAEARALASGRPLSVESFRSSALADRVRARVRDGVDVILAQSAAMAEYVREFDHVPRVMDFVDLDSEKWRTYAELRPFPWSLVFRMESERLARYESEVARSFDRSLFISSKEAEIFAGRSPAARTTVVPNGVDLEYFAPSAGERPERRRNACVFTGVMDYFPNVDAMSWFCREILPAVRREVPDAEALVVGRTPSRAVRRLAREAGVTVTGAVPDTRTWLARAKVAVAPFRVARGVQNKVLEAMAMGVPVVGTSLAFQGIPAGAEDGIAVADRRESFAAGVTRLLRDDDLRAAMGGRCRAFAERELRWSAHAASLERILEEVVRERRAVGVSA